MPIGQIAFRERDKQLSVYIQNNGVGPLIVESLTYFKKDKKHPDIRSCLDLNPKSYMHLIGDAEKKIILPGAYLKIFSTKFERHEEEIEKEYVRKQLSGILLKVVYKDVYNNKTTIQRDFTWFSRHGNDQPE